MAIKFKQAFAKTGMALALAASAGLAQAAVDIVDVTVEQTLARNAQDLFEFTGTFEATGDGSDGFTFGVEIEGSCVSSRTEEDVATLSIVGNEYTLTLLDTAVVDAALTEFDPGQRFPLPAFTYCATNNFDQTSDKADMTWNLIVPGTTEDVLRMSVAKNADDSVLKVDLYNAHTTIEPTSIDLVVDMGPITCDDLTNVPSARVNGTAVATANITCGPNISVPDVTLTNGMVIELDNGLPQNWHLELEIYYPHTTPADPLNYSITALADYNGGIAKNSTSGMAVVNPTLTGSADNAREDELSCSNISLESGESCNYGHNGYDISISLGANDSLSANSLVTLDLPDSDLRRPLDCSVRPRIINGDSTTLIDLADVFCLHDHIEIVLDDGLPQGGSLQLGTQELACATDCSVSYILNLHDAATNSRVREESSFTAYDAPRGNDDSLAALIAFMSLLASIWYFRREKALKAA